MKTKTVVPYSEQSGSKKEQVAQMFNSISHKYDFLNHFLSLGIDKLWRKKAVNYLKKYNPKDVLDIATGTGDFAIQCLKANPNKIIGIDISTGMLEVGRRKLEKQGLTSQIELLEGDSENIQFEDNSFDAAIVAFGVRNFENLEKGLLEINRVLKKDGVLIVLEFSKPSVFPFKQIYNVYFNHILPRFGKAISKDSAAYTYLPESVKAFPDGQAFMDILKKVNFTPIKWKPLTFGISSIYIGQK